MKTDVGRKDLNKKAIGGLLLLIVSLAMALFIPARTLDYWQAWVFLALFFVPVLAITVYLMKNDPDLLERRIRSGPRAEKQLSQKVTLFTIRLAFGAMIVVSALDHRFAWSRVPLYMVAAGDVLVAIGLLVGFCVFKANTFASATIEVADGQRVISTGPYSLVRHPMYVGILIMVMGVPLALGSWWGLLAVVPIKLALVWRLIDEERFLAKSLPGYAEYRTRVRYRLMPFIWLQIAFVCGLTPVFGVRAGARRAPTCFDAKLLVNSPGARGGRSVVTENAEPYRRLAGCLR